MSAGDREQDRVDRHVRNELVRYLYRQTGFSLFVVFINASTLALIFAYLEDPVAPAAWWACMMLAVGARLMLLRGFRRDDHGDDDRDLAPWERRYALASAVTGVIWGAGGVLLAWDSPLAYRMLVLLFSAGMAAGAVSVLASDLRAFAGYLVTSLVPIGLFLLVQGEAVQIVLGLTVFIFMTAVYMSGARLHRILRESLRLGFENKELADEMARVNEELSIANSDLERLSFTDALTQVPNRRFLDLTLEKEWARAVRESLPLAAIFCDVDFFKRYNDSHGHIAGDHALRKVTDAIARSLKRHTDFLARLGGEEFVVLLPNTGKEGALAIARSICAEVERMALPHASSPVSRFLTVSLGVSSCVPGEGLAGRIDGEDLLRCADKALYEAKSGGRNRVCYREVRVDPDPGVNGASAPARRYGRQRRTNG